MYSKCWQSNNIDSKGLTALITRSKSSMTMAKSISNCNIIEAGQICLLQGGEGDQLQLALQPEFC